MSPVDEIRRRYWLEPFVPFEVELHDGRRLYVSQKFRVGISPSNKTVTVVTPGDNLHLLTADQIRRVLPEEVVHPTERTGT